MVMQNMKVIIVQTNLIRYIIYLNRLQYTNCYESLNITTTHLNDTLRESDIHQPNSTLMIDGVKSTREKKLCYHLFDASRGQHLAITIVARYIYIVYGHLSKDQVKNGSVGLRNEIHVWKKNMNLIIFEPMVTQMFEKSTICTLKKK